MAEVLRELYAPFLRTEKPFLVMSPESAEMTKYVANALLATKISFINEVANLCERMAADINDVRRGIGHDSRIGFAFLFPGVGYGGSCFPKDVQALASMARAAGVEPRILGRGRRGEHDVKRRCSADKIDRAFRRPAAGPAVAVWGLAFKPRTDDIRDAPALVLIDRLLGRRRHACGSTILRRWKTSGESMASRIDVRRAAVSTTLEGADALAIVTEWNEFLHPDFEEMAAGHEGPRDLRRP